jgi:hypothetical protein
LPGLQCGKQIDKESMRLYSSDLRSEKKIATETRKHRKKAENKSSLKIHTPKFLCRGGLGFRVTSYTQYSPANPDAHFLQPGNYRQLFVK